jgi:hypothetical protein
VVNRLSDCGPVGSDREKARPARLRTAQPQNWLALQAPPLRDIWVVKGLLSTIGDKSREAI